MTHWAEQYIGKPWAIDGYGPDAFSCSGLLRWVYKTHYNTELPDWLGINENNRPEMLRTFLEATHSGIWHPLKFPGTIVDGAAVGLGHNRFVCHVGIYLAIDRGVVLHSCQSKGVLCEPVATLRGQGFNRISFYRHCSWPT